MENKMEMKPTKKRMRSSNWDEEEKRLLRQLVTDKIDIVENKDSSTNTNLKKKAAWHDILSSFNCVNNKQRDMTQLITQWRKTKGQVKSRESEYRRARLMTGGGPPPPSPPPEDLEIIQAIPNEFVVDSNCFDSDSIFLKNIKQSQVTVTTEESQQAKPESEIQIISNSSNQIIDSEKTDKISYPLAEIETIKLASTPRASMSSSILKDKNLKRKLYKPTKKQNKRIDDDYEHQLFLLAKSSKENKEQREDELHRKRMTILDLEQQYWEKKLKN